MKSKLFTLVALLLTVSAVMGQISTEGLVAYYPFNGNANDESGNGNDGIVHGATLDSDRFDNPNSAFNFDGINDYIELPLSLIDGQEGTIICWIQLADSIQRSAMFGAGATTTNPSTFGFYVWPYGEGPVQNRFLHVVDSRQCGGVQKQLGDTLTYPTVGSWHLVALKSDGVETQMYMDGILLNNLWYGLYGGGRGEWFSDICSLTYASIGRRIRKIDEIYFNGVIDEFRIYNRPLEDQEIMALYNEGNSTDNKPPSDKSTFKVYPNPTSDLLYINTGDYTLMDGYSIKIINQLGSVFFESEIDNELYEIDLTNWSGVGLYYLQLIDSGSQIIDIRKIILE